MSIEAVTLDSSSGVSVKSFREVRTAIENSFKDIFPSLNTAASTPDGMIIDLLSYMYVELSQVIQGSAAAMDVDFAEGVFLDALAKINGLTRADGETDASLRARIREGSFHGLATFENMLTYLRQNISPNVQMSEDYDSRSFSVFVPEDFSVNDIDPTDADWAKIRTDGRAVSVDTYVAQKIWNCKPAGIKSKGSASNTGTAIDAAGNVHEVSFGKVQGVDFDVKITITEYDEEILPDDYAEVISAAVVEWCAANLTVGKDFIPKRLSIPVYKSVDGVDDVYIQIKKHGTSTWSDTRVALDFNQYASVSLDNVSVGK